MKAITQKQRFDDFIIRRYPELDLDRDTLFINALYEAYLLGYKDASEEYTDTLNYVLEAINEGAKKNADQS